MWNIAVLILNNLFLQANEDDQTAADLAVVLFETATLRSGYQLADTKAYGDRIERMLRLSMNVDLDEQVSTIHMCKPVHLTSSLDAWSLSCFHIFHDLSVLRLRKSQKRSLRNLQRKGRQRMWKRYQKMMQKIR